MQKSSRVKWKIAATILLASIEAAHGATGAMGTGTPQFAVLGNVMGPYAKLRRSLMLASAFRPDAAFCS
jgi:hypothetical protein